MPVESPSYVDIKLEIINNTDIAVGPAGGKSRDLTKRLEINNRRTLCELE